MPSSLGGNPEPSDAAIHDPTGVTRQEAAHPRSALYGLPPVGKEHS
jgi:hypothetical protein